MSSELLVIADLETTGLNPRRDDILEVACQVVTVDLEDVAEPFHRVLGFDSADVEEQMLGKAQYYRLDPVVIAMHQASGLTAECAASDEFVGSVARTWDAYLTACGVPPRGAPMDERPLLVGSSAHFDRGFLTERMKPIVDRLHYRNVDISTLRSLCRLWAPELTYEPAKTHRALEDVTEVLAELRHYREALFWPIRTVA